MFYTDATHWVAAIVEARKLWNNDEERGKIERMTGPNWRKAIWKTTGDFRVSRNIPILHRDHFLKLIGNARISDFGSFVSETRKIVRVFKQHQVRENKLLNNKGEKKRKSFSPMSGVSKVIFHRFPNHGFIFDDQAKIAISHAGLLAPFHDSLTDWGGSIPNDNSLEADFVAVAAAWERYFAPLKANIVENVRLPQYQPVLPHEHDIFAIRILDKLLWLSGEDPQKGPEKIGDLCRQADDTTRQAGHSLASCAQNILVEV